METLMERNFPFPDAYISYALSQNILFKLL